jgi:tripartite-type tricarboxylate transporter receptor subunit TctC
MTCGQSPKELRYRNLKRTMVAAVLLATPQSVWAATVADFFRGKVISIYVGYGAGGGFDFYGRLASRHLGKHIPGQPRVVVQNMPGAGSLRAANFLYNVAPKDGTALGVISPNSVVDGALGTPNVQYQAQRFNWIGRIGPNVDVTLTWYKSPAKTIEEAKVNSVALAASGPGSTSEFLPRLLNNIVGTKFKVVPGYAGATEGMLAMERGEVDGAMTSWNTLRTTKADWLKEKKVQVLVQYVPERLSDMADVPSIGDLGKTTEDRQVLMLFATGGVIGKAIMAPPDVPRETVDALRQGMDAMFKDPQFLAEVESTSTEFDSLSGAELQKEIEKAAVVPASVINRARQALGM